MSTAVTYQVELSTDGQHRVTVTGDDPVAVQEALAWARGIFLKLPPTPTARDKAKHPSIAPPDGESPNCPQHQTPLIWVSKGRQGPFWSCHQKQDDGSWCTFTRETAG